jgi:hypothetical protein
LTELGRKIGFLAGAIAMVVTVIIGVVNDGNMAIVSIFGAIGGILFGLGGSMIGNLMHNYILDAARKEAEGNLMKEELAMRASLDRSHEANTGGSSI